MFICLRLEENTTVPENSNKVCWCLPLFALWLFFVSEGSCDISHYYACWALTATLKYRSVGLPVRSVLNSWKLLHLLWQFLQDTPFFRIHTTSRCPGAHVSLISEKFSLCLLKAQLHSCVQYATVEVLLLLCDQICHLLPSLLGKTGLGRISSVSRSTNLLQ